MNAFVWIDVSSVEQAAAELAATRGGQSGVVSEGGAVLKAGGLDLLDQMKEGLIAPGRVVNLRRAARPGDVHGLNEIREAPADGPREACLRIGALVTLQRVADDPLVRRLAPALAQAAAGAATPQVRQVATVGGNLLQRPRCWYLRSALHPCKKKGGGVCFAQEGENELHAIFDNAVCAAVAPSSLATALVALEGQVVAVGPGAAPRRMLVSDLLLAPSQAGPPGSPTSLVHDHRLAPAEVLTTVEVPLRPGRRSAYVRAKQKQSFDWPLVEIAVSLPAAGAAQQGADPKAGADAGPRVVLGAVAAVPWRARDAEAALSRLARPLDDAAGLRQVAEAALRGARPLAHNGYKLDVVRAMVIRAVHQALGGQNLGGHESP